MIKGLSNGSRKCPDISREEPRNHLCAPVRPDAPNLWLLSWWNIHTRIAKTSPIDARGATLIPKHRRDFLGVPPGDQIEWHLVRDGYPLGRHEPFDHQRAAFEPEASPSKCGRPMAESVPDANSGRATRITSFDL